MPAPVQLSRMVFRPEAALAESSLSEMLRDIEQSQRFPDV